MAVTTRFLVFSAILLVAFCFVLYPRFWTNNYEDPQPLTPAAASIPINIIPPIGFGTWRIDTSKVNTVVIVCS
jgi:hypothetical protein